MEGNMLSRPDFKQKQIVLAFVSRGDRLSFKNDNVIIKNEKNEVKLQTSCYRLFSIFIVGHFTITSGLLQRAKKFGFSIVLMSHNLKPYDCLNAPAEGNTLLRQKQYAYNSDKIAQRLVHNKIQNQIQVLKKIRNKDLKMKQGVESLMRYKESVMGDSLTLKQILGFEGMASKIYFQSLYNKYQWKARRPRTKMDATNCLLDIGYSLLFNFVDSLLCLYGFDVYKGVYHTQFFQRKSLVCDLVEPFRPIIDYKIRKAYNLKQIKLDDFTRVNNQYTLFGKKSVSYVGMFIEELIHRKEEIFLYIQSYYRAFIRELPIENYPYFKIEHSLDIREVAC